MYRPPGEPQLRPRAAVPPPPPPGMANYAPPRPLPPPLHGRPFTTSQFSYSLPGQSFQMQPSSGLHVPSFVPPLPSDLPPPPPSSPPPSPPPLPSESVVGPTKHPGHSGSNETPLKTDTFLRDSGYGMLNHQESSLPRAEKNQVSLSLDPRKIVEQRQQDSVWNATYQDTLDEEAGSASDMDMDLEDHLGIHITRAAVDGELKSGPTPYRPSIEVEKEDDRRNNDGLGLREGKMNADSGVYDARTADQLKASLSARGLAKEHQASRGNEDEQLKHDLFREDVLEQGSVFRSQTSMLNKECPRARSSRWGSPTWVHNEDENHDLLTACSGNLEHLSSSCNTNNNTSRNWQPRFSPADGSLNSEVPASVERTIEVPEDPQRQDSASQMANQSSKIDIRSNSVLQGEKQDPKVDEFGRLVQEGVSDSESEGYRLPMVESGRASRKGGSASNSEEDRRSLKRKRRYSRSRSRSRSRASSGSRSRSRSRSRSSTSRSRGSRTPTRSPGERRWRRRSFSRSPRRKPRWNRSRSRSPYMRRSYSRTPPRDSRRRVVMSRGERDWRGDRDYFGRGRRAVRGSGASTCFHYARGRCLRGSSCRFLHVNRDSPMQDRGGWWRDDQFERHSFRDEDGVQESHMIDRQDRQKLAREPWSERHDGWDSSGQDGVGERQRRGTVSSAKILPQEDGCIVGGELAADRFASPTPAKESWAPAESKGAQFLGSSDLREGYSGMPQTSMEREVGAAEQASSNLLKEWNVLELTDKMDNVIRDVELAAIKAGKDGLEEVGSRNKQGDTDSSEIEKEVVQEYGVEVRGDERLGTNGDMDIVDDMKLSPDTGEQGPKQEIGASGDGAMAVPQMPGNYNGNVKLEPIDEGGVSRDTSSLGEKAVETAAKADPSMETQVGVSRDSSSLEEQAVECATKADAMESQAGEGLSLFRLPLNSKEGGPHVVLEEVVEEPMLGTAGVLMKAEVSQSLPVGTIAPMKPSAPQAQEIPAGHPASLPAMPPPVAPLLPTPVGQHNICIGQPVFTQGQQHTPIGQSYPRQLMGSTQHGVLARNLPHATPYGSYRLPSSVPASNLGDQVTGQMSKLNSGGTGYLAVAGGWGQLGFHPRAPGQEITPFSQAQGHPNYGRPSLGPQPFGVSFFGIPPNSADQVTKHHGQPNAAEQFPQHHGPGFGQPIPGVPISQQQQHGLSSDMAASFSQHHLAPLQSQAPFPLQHPPSQIHRPLSHGGASYLPYVHPQPGSSQISASTQQAGHMNQYATTPTVSTIPPPPFLSTQQGVSSTSSLPTEQPHPSGGAALSQFHATTFMNPAFAASVPPSQSSIPWNYAATQGSVLPSKGQSYAYPLTTIPPLSSLVQVPQTTNPSSQNNQYDPLSDIPGSDGSPKHSVKAPEAAISTGGTTTAASAQPLFTSNANAPTDMRTGETTVPLAAPLDPSMKVNGADTKSTTEAATDAENLSPENWSPPGQPAEGTEPGQEQQALSKKSSRGLKMLRAAIAEHVKEVLKPTWKEGYMSKEAFKTIAKKAVEKVIGNVPSHHIPKTQEKVDQYMKASRPKISKLVQGYVDKYLKL